VLKEHASRATCALDRIVDGGLLRILAVPQPLLEGSRRQRITPKNNVRDSKTRSALPMVDSGSVVPYNSM
jgi:hypothetical protein